MSKAQAIFNGLITALALLLITGILAALTIGIWRLAGYLWGM